jgi:hypothetical protein
MKTQAERYKNLIAEFGDIGNAVKVLYNEYGARNFARADLRRADLTEADLRRADLTQADLKMANLKRADLRRADLRRADLRRADLRRADLTEADLTEADLTGADLTEADLTQADLTYANLTGADIDLSSWPLRCGGLSVHIDDKIAIQLLFHAVQNILSSPNTSERVKSIVNTKEVIDLCNEFHRDDVDRIEYRELNN